jgi:hypothetical protein
MNRYLCTIRMVWRIMADMLDMWLAIRLLCNNQALYLDEVRKGGCTTEESYRKKTHKDIQSRHKMKRLSIVRAQWQFHLAEDLMLKKQHLGVIEASHMAADIIADCEDHGFIRTINNDPTKKDELLITLTKKGSDFKSFWYLLKHVKDELGPTIAWGITTTVAIVSGLVAIILRIF